jgi:hypothetical protein
VTSLEYWRLKLYFHQLKEIVGSVEVQNPSCRESQPVKYSQNIMAPVLVYLLSGIEAGMLPGIEAVPFLILQFQPLIAE